MIECLRPQIQKKRDVDRTQKDITRFYNMNLRSSRNEIIKNLNWFKKSKVTNDTNRGELAITSVQQNNEKPLSIIYIYI